MPPLPSTGRRRALFVAALSTLLLAPLGVMASHSQATSVDATAQGTTSSEFHIVELVDPTLPSYTGGIDGLARTSPEPGRKLDTTTEAARAYTARLERQHDDVLATVGARAVPGRHYTTALNGVAVRGLSAQDVRKLETNPQVKKVWKSARRQGSTINTPESLGLAGPQGAWNTAVGGPANAGRGMIIGVIDAGIWPEHPSFAPLKDTPDQAQIDAKFPPSKRTCDQGKSGPPMVCNNKIIAAKYYDRAFTWPSTDYRSPRGKTNHGSGTAAAAAGNHGVPVVIHGENYGTMSGMAPAARLSVYKALYESGDIVDGDLIDLVGAIDDAVKDRVDVINYSVTTQRDAATGIESVAFFNAAKAGVLVVSTAGNEGRSYGEGSVMATSPWMLSVAGVTREWTATRDVTLGNGTTVTGTGFSTKTLTGALIRARDAEIPDPNADPTTTGLCARKDEKVPGRPQPFLQLDPEKVRGKIVVCERGVFGVFYKSEAVAAAGGIGVINVNMPGGGTDTWVDFTKVPAVHLEAEPGKKVLDYAAAPGATVSVAPSKGGKSTAPKYWQDSSPGPASLGNGDLLKPDLAAPAVSVLTAANPAVTSTGADVDALSGTSIAAPHVAGIAALVKQAHPTWTPPMIQSALMTTATHTDNTGSPIKAPSGRDATPHEIGSGQVNAKAALNPGIVITSEPAQWLAFACAVGQWQLYRPSDCVGVSTMKATELNYPSIASGALTGTETFTRSIVNVTNTPLKITRTLKLPAGYQGETRPTSTITLNPGQSQPLRLYVNRQDAPLDVWSYGSLTLTSDQGHTAVLPIALRPSDMRTPHTAVKADGKAGTIDASVTPNQNGTMAVRPLGYATETVRTHTITPKMTGFSVTVAPGTAAIAWRIPVENPAANVPLAAPPYTVNVVKNGKVVARNMDFDMYGVTVLANPEPGVYEVSIKGELPQISVPNAPVHQYVLSNAPATPDITAKVKDGSNPARLNTPVAVSVSWKNAPKGFSLFGAEATLTPEKAGEVPVKGIIPVMLVN